jgi:hypothetical protein
MKKADRRAYVRDQARELAATGDFTDYLDIEIHLRTHGYHEAEDWLADSDIRQQLDKICARSRAAH